jgi:lysozyme
MGGMPHTNAAGVSLIESFEGERLRSYPDPGTGGDPWTVGFGHTASVHPGETITQAQAVAFLRGDLAVAEIAVAHATEISLTPNQFAALVSFEYNTGAFGGGAPIVGCINARDWAGAMEHLARYVYAGGAVMDGLVRRRTAERALFLTPGG